MPSTAQISEWSGSMPTWHQYAPHHFIWQFSCTASLISPTKLWDKIPQLPGFSWIKPCYLFPKYQVYWSKRCGPACLTMPCPQPWTFSFKELQYPVFFHERQRSTWYPGDHGTDISPADWRKTEANPSEFDTDAPDPALAPAPGTPIVGGLTYEEGRYMTEEVVPSIGLQPAVDLAEVNHTQLAASKEGSQGTVAWRQMWLLRVLVRWGREGAMSGTSFLLPVPPPFWWPVILL